MSLHHHREKIKAASDAESAHGCQSLEPIRMSFAEWLYRMAEARLPAAARVLGIYAAIFNVAGNAKLAQMVGMSSKTYDTWRGYMTAHGWLISIGVSEGRGAPRVRLLPALNGHLVHFDENHEAQPIDIPTTVYTRRRDKRIICSAALRLKTREAFDYTCQRCGFRCAPGDVVLHRGRLVTSSFLTVDRLVPGSKGGLYSEDNVTLACSECNSLRRDVLGALGQSLAERLATQ